jgi:hypothetical protein
MIRRAKESTALSLFDCFCIEHCFSRQRQLLANPHEYLDEEGFADLYLTLNDDTLILELKSYSAFIRSYLHAFRSGDCLEFFIHTRPDPSNHSHNLFCHHFLCLPDFEGAPLFKEITSWRSGQTRALASQSDLFIERELHPDSYTLTLEIGLNALYGFEAQDKMSLGFCYRHYSSKGRQTFFASNTANLGFQPQHWPICTFI